MAVSISWKRRVLFAIVAATVLVAITAVPSMVGAAPAKKYALAVSPTTATVGLPTTVTVKVTNETPPGTNSNFSSFYVTVPFSITGAIQLPPTPLAGSTNPNLSATVGVDPSNSRRILVRSLDAVNKGQFVNLTFTATPASCTGSPYNWVTNDFSLVKVANGASLNGDTFTPTSASLDVETTVSCGPPALSVTKTADAENVVAGNPIGYTITATSSGGGSATGVTLTDTLPTDTDTSWSIADGTGAALCEIAAGVLTCDFGDMASGTSFTVHISSPTMGDTVADSPVQNTATVDADNTTPDSATASIDIFERTIACGGTESAGEEGGTVVNVTLVANAGCTPKNATITATDVDPVFQHKIEILASGSGGPVTFLVESTWAPVSIPEGQPTPLTTVSPACAPGEGCAPASTEPEVWCEGAFNEGSPTLGAIMPAHHSWCRITQDTTIVAGGLKQVHEFSLLINPDPIRGRA
jgi:uncharacterized repeat protein (TIGR01451 family)